MFGKHLTTALDLGQHSVKYVVAEPAHGRIHELWQAELMEERRSLEQAMTGDDLRERLNALLHSCQHDCKAFNPNVVTAIQGEGILCRYLELPHLTGKELEFAVPSAARKHIPFPIDEMSLSHVSVPLINSDKNKCGVFFVAAPRSSVEEQRALLQGCGLEIKRMEVPALALTREFSANHKTETGHCHALINIGFRLTHLVVVRDGFPYFARDFTLGGRDFTYAFQMAEQNTWAESETFNRSYDVKDRNVAIEPYLMRWLQEVKKSLNFFGYQFPAKTMSIQQVHLSGGSVAMRGLDQRLAEYIGLPVVQDGWNRLKPAGNQTSTAPVGIFKVAMGLALLD